MHGGGSPHAMAAFLIALLARTVMTSVSGNNQVKVSTCGSHPDNLSLRAAQPPHRQRVAAGGGDEGGGWSRCTKAGYQVTLASGSVL